MTRMMCGSREELIRTGVLYKALDHYNDMLEVTSRMQTPFTRLNSRACRNSGRSSGSTAWVGAGQHRRGGSAIYMVRARVKTPEKLGGEW